MIIARLLKMEEELVVTAIKLGWKPNIKDLWSKWLNLIGADADTTVGLMCIDLLEERCPSDVAKLEWLIERGFISTEAEEYLESIVSIVSIENVKQDRIDKYVNEMSQWVSNDGDHEGEHSEADELLCRLLVELGYEDVVEEWNKVYKW